MDLFGEQYLSNLVPIPLLESKVIVGMDWLIPNGPMIDFGQQLVRVQTLIEKELVILCNGAQRGLALCSAARAKHYL